MTSTNIGVLEMTNTNIGVLEMSSTNIDILEMTSTNIDVLERHALVQLVEALHYKREDRGFDSRWCHCNFSLA
jgi:hypothetical protein